MPDLTSPKLTKRQYFVVASLLFGLFFGAGNLIFPLHLGQLAGGHWVGAAAGFLVTGVLLPLLSVMAIAITGTIPCQVDTYKNENTIFLIRPNRGNIPPRFGHFF